MLVVKLELWPGGHPSGARQLGEIHIANDMTGTERQGNYDVALAHAGKFWGTPGWWKRGRVLAHVRELSPYHLVLAALEATIGRGAPRERALRSHADTKPCRGCGQPIVWTTTSTGKRMPLDPEPLAVVLEGGGPLRVVLEDGRVVAARTAEATDLSEPVTARASHFSSCPKAENFRGSGR